MKVDLIEKHADFFFDKEGVMIATDIEKIDFAVMGELIYDGKNVAILNRNNKDFFALKNIAPHIREKLQQSQEVTIIEKDKESIYSYKVKVHLTDDLGFEDDFDKLAEEVITELKEKMSPEDFKNFVKESQNFIQTPED